LVQENTKSPGPWTKIAAPTGAEDLFAVGLCDDAPVARICAVGAQVLAVSDVMSSDLVFRAVPTDNGGPPGRGTNQWWGCTRGR
jgi:hypothetical protein